jgi:hypothetical protein
MEGDPPAIVFVLIALVFCFLCFVIGPLLMA